MLPIPPKPAGGLPSPLTQAAPNVGPVSQPQGNQGNIQAAMSKVSNAIKMLEEALPMIPMGNELHTEILNSAKNLSKHMNKEGETPTTPKLDISSILQMIKGQAQGAPQAAMAKMLPPQPPTQVAA